MSIIAYEGPAGSGKGFHLSQLKGLLQHEASVKFLPRPSLPRDLGPEVGAWSSSYLEYMAIAAATMMPETTFYVDRFVLSRWVYKAIDTDNGLVDLQLERKVAQSWFDMRNLADDEAFRRIGGILRLHCEANIKVLMPSIGQLAANRMQGRAQGREYPFSPCQELDLYRQVATRIGRANIPGLTIDILEF
jgi:hypothetical protein